MKNKEKFLRGVKHFFWIDTTELLHHLGVTDVAQPAEPKSRLTIAGIYENEISLGHMYASIEYINTKGELVSFDMTDHMAVIYQKDEFFDLLDDAEFID